VSKSRTFLAIVCLVVLTGCRPAVVILPPHLKTVAVATFGNRTTNYGLESLLTNQTIRQFQQDGRLSVVSEDSADLLIKAEIRQYNDDVILVDPTTNRPKQYRLTVVYNLTAVDQVDQRALFDETNLAQTVLYYTADFPGAVSMTEDQAREQLAQDLGLSIVRRTIEGN